MYYSAQKSSLMLAFTFILEISPVLIYSDFRKFVLNALFLLHSSFSAFCAVFIFDDIFCSSISAFSEMKNSPQKTSESHRSISVDIGKAVSDLLLNPSDYSRL